MMCCCFAADRRKNEGGRGSLICIISGQSQICQVKVNKFGEDGSQAALEAAVNFMKALAIKYQSGEISKEQLYENRDKGLAEAARATP